MDMTIPIVRMINLKKKVMSLSMTAIGSNKNKDKI